MTGRPRRIFLVGFYGVHNLGDEAIRAAIDRAAPAAGAQIVAVASRDHADPDPRAVPVSGPGLLRYLRAIVRADRVVLGGGGILKDEGLRIPIELFVTALAARLLRRELTLLAVGVGPFYSRPGRWLAAATARLASVRTVRDVDSVEALRALGVGRVTLGADPTFTYDAVDPGIDAAPDGATPERSRRVVVSLRPWFLRQADGAAARTLLREAVADALAALIERGWTVEVISLYWPRDHAESTALVADGRLAGAEVVEHELTWPDLAARVARADLVIAMRYHAVAAAAQAGRPTIALAYEPKVRSLAADLSLPSLDVDDPLLRSRLGELVARELAAPGTSVADAAAIAALRDRAWLAIRHALGPAADGSGRAEDG